MKIVKAALAVTATFVSLAVLSGCTASPTTKEVAVPKTVRYGTGLSVDKKVSATGADRLTVLTAINAAVGTSKSKADANGFIYDNISSASYDLAANSPYFVNKTRTSTACKAGKAQGTDIGQGYYVIGDAFIMPTTGRTLAAAGVNKDLATVVKTLIKNKTITTAYATALKGDGKYEFTTKTGNTLRIKTTVANNNVAVIRVSNVLQADTCYDLNGLPYTTLAAVKAWQQADKKAGAF